MKKLLVATVVLLIGVRQSQAAFHWNQGVTPTVGEALQIDLIDSEVVLDVNGDPVPGGIVSSLTDTLYGIAKVTGIHSAIDGTTYWTPSADQEIVMEFSGFTVSKLPAAPPGTSDITFTGGLVKWYFDSTPDYDSSTGPIDAGWTSVAADNGVGNAGDVHWFDTVGVAGRDASYPTATLVARDSQTAIVNGSEVWLTGVGQGLLDITTYYNPPEPFNENRNMLFDNKFTTHYEDVFAGTYTPWESINGWSLNSVDPVYTQYVPEPASIITWGLLLGCAFGFGRRRKNA